MAVHHLIICTSCRVPGEAPLGEAMLAQLAQALPGFAVSETECMSGCARPCAVAFRAEGKASYLFGDITGENLPDLIAFANHFSSLPDGWIVDARPLGALRTKAIARIPLPQVSQPGDETA